MINSIISMRNKYLRKSKMLPYLRYTFLVSLTFFIANSSSAQDSIRVTNTELDIGRNLQSVLDFENIHIEQLGFEGNSLNGKSYTITLEEFKGHEKNSTSILFDGTEDDIFKIRDGKETLEFLFKCSDSKLKIVIRGKIFASKKQYFNLLSDEDLYAVKDFFGSKSTINIGANGSHTLFAIITPTIHKNGTASYCEVAQSSVKPEDIGRVFLIPHYFLVKIEFH